MRRRLPISNNFQPLHVAGACQRRRGRPLLSQPPSKNIGSGTIIAETDQEGKDMPNIKVFKPFQTSKDPLRIVLPGVFKKLMGKGSWQQYFFFIVCGGQEQRVRLDERPSALFDALDRRGRKQ